MSAPELLTPAEFEERVGVPVPESVIRNLQEVRAMEILSPEEFFDRVGPPETWRPLGEPRCVAGCHLDIHTSVMWHSPGCPHLPLHEPDPDQLELLSPADQEPDDE